jgi:hypothetical protein
MVTSTMTSPSRRDLRLRSRMTVTGAQQTDALTAARAEALFTSDVSAASTLSRDEYMEAIRRALLRHGGVRGCAAEVAAQYGDHPDTAAPRMRWARQVVQSVSVRPVPHPIALHADRSAGSVHLVSAVR